MNNFFFIDFDNTIFSHRTGKIPEIYPHIAFIRIV